MKRLVVLCVLAACGHPTASSATEPAIANQSRVDDSRGAAPGDAGGGSATVVQRDERGGILELGGYRDAAMARAEDVMNAHCGLRAWTIVQEGEELLGQVVAWRVHYACGTPSP